MDFTLRHFLTPLMDGLSRAGHQVVGVCSDGPFVADLREAGYRVETISIERSHNIYSHFKSYRSLVKLFRQEKFDIVHVHTPVAGLIGRAAAWHAGVSKIAYTAHGFYFHEHMPWPKRALYILLEWLAGRVTDVLLTQAEEDAQTARRYRLCRGGVVSAIGNGVNPARFVPDPSIRQDIRKDLGVADSTVVIVMVGRLVAEKGYLELFEALKSVPAELWIVGEKLASDHASDISQAISNIDADPDLSARIRFLGYRDDVPNILRAADIFTLPSHREGMPRSIIEAMFTELPVVATDIRGTREEVVEGKTGLLVPVGDRAALASALTRLAGNPQLRARLGRAGRARAEKHYNESAVVARQLALLRLN